MTERKREVVNDAWPPFRLLKPEISVTISGGLEREERGDVMRGGQGFRGE